METQTTIIKTEIQSIEAKELLNRFNSLENRLAQLQKTVNPKQKTVLLTRKQVAKLLNISLPTLHAWSKNKVLNPFRIGNQVRYKENEVLEALQAINQNR